MRVEADIAFHEALKVNRNLVGRDRCFGQNGQCGHDAECTGGELLGKAGDWLFVVSDFGVNAGAVRYDGIMLRRMRK
jgi:hypothetical protein